MKRTKRRWPAATAAAACVVLLAACRQPEGAMPSPREDQPNRIIDISRDLQNVARQDPQAPSELLDDLANLESPPRPPERVKVLAQALSDALGGRSLPDAEAKRIADLLFVAVSAGDLSRSQIQQVGAQLQEALLDAGVAEEPAERASGAAIALANEASANQRRWYQR